MFLVCLALFCFELAPLYILSRKKTQFFKEIKKKLSTKARQLKHNKIKRTKILGNLRNIYKTSTKSHQKHLISYLFIPKGEHKLS